MDGGILIYIPNIVWESNWQYCMAQKFDRVKFWRMIQV